VVIKAIKPDNDYHPWNLVDDRDREMYEPNIKECINHTGYGESEVYLLEVYLVDKNIDVKSITKENIDNTAIFI